MKSSVTYNLISRLILAVSTLLLVACLVLNGVARWSGCTSKHCLPLVKIAMHNVGTVDSLNHTIFALTKAVSHLSRVPEGEVFPAIREMLSTPTTYNINFNGYSSTTPKGTTYHSMPNALDAPYLLLNELALHMPDSSKWQENFSWSFKQYIALGPSTAIHNSLKADIFTGKMVKDIWKWVFWLDAACLVLVTTINITARKKLSEDRSTAVVFTCLPLLCLAGITLGMHIFNWMTLKHFGRESYLELQKTLRLHLAKTLNSGGRDTYYGATLALKVLWIAGYLVGVIALLQ